MNKNEAESALDAIEQEIAAMLANSIGEMGIIGGGVVKYRRREDGKIVADEAKSLPEFMKEGEH